MELVGGMFLKWDSWHTSGYSCPREHTSAATMTVKMGLERLWCYRWAAFLLLQRRSAELVRRAVFGSDSRRACG